MSEQTSEHEAAQDAELTKLDSTYGQGEPPAEPAADEPVLDADGDPVYPYTVSGTFQAEDQHDAYKLLQAHFLELSRTGNGTLTGVSVSKA